MNKSRRKWLLDFLHDDRRVLSQAESELLDTNPQSGGSYRVAIRGVRPGENFCACPDFATNDLGTCKHIEFVLGKLEKKRGGRKALARAQVVQQLSDALSRLIAGLAR